MAEVEIAGAKIKGGKLMLLVPIVSALGGGLWGGFEFYKDYLNMKDQIQNYTAPDLSGFDKRIDLVQQEVTMLQSEMGMILEEVQLVADVAKELKNDLKSDVRRIETIVEDVEQRVKEDSRDNEKELKTTIDNLEADVEKVEDKLTTAMKELQESIDKQIKTTLANPLSQMTK